MNINNGIFIRALAVQSSLSLAAFSMAAVEARNDEPPSRGTHREVQVVAPTYRDVLEERVERAQQRLPVGEAAGQNRNEGAFVGEFHPGNQKNVPWNAEQRPLTPEERDAQTKLFIEQCAELSKLATPPAVPIREFVRALQLLPEASPCNPMALGSILGGMVDKNTAPLTAEELAFLHRQLTANPYLAELWNANLPSKQFTFGAEAELLGKLEINNHLHPAKSRDVSRLANSLAEAFEIFFIERRCFEEAQCASRSALGYSALERALMDCLVHGEQLADAVAGESPERASAILALLGGAALVSSPELGSNTRPIASALIATALRIGSFQHGVGVATEEARRRDGVIKNQASDLLGSLLASVWDVNNQDDQARSAAFEHLSYEATRNLEEIARTIAMSTSGAVSEPERRKVEGALKRGLPSGRPGVQASEQFDSLLREVKGWAHLPGFSPDEGRSLAGALYALQCLNPENYPSLYMRWAELNKMDGEFNLSAMRLGSSRIAGAPGVGELILSAENRHQEMLKTLRTEGILTLRQKQQEDIEFVVRRIVEQVTGNPIGTLNESEVVVDPTRASEQLRIISNKVRDPHDELGERVQRIEIRKAIARRVLSLPGSSPNREQIELLSRVAGMDPDLGLRNGVQIPLQGNHDHLFASQDDLIRLVRLLQQQPESCAPELFDFLRDTRRNELKLRGVIQEAWK
jgi:hypothetical protein